MPSEVKSIYELRCSCNSYPWGKTGKESIAARLCEKQPGWGGDGPKQDFKIDNSSPYAEMWMGTYPELPSYVAETGEDLQDVLDAHPKELIGENVLQKFGHSKLPYLPKVLSISKALPLQVHPNKGLAQKLHEKDPEQFTDPNHKPEIALALSEFEAFCGFKPLAEIGKLMKLDVLKEFLPAGQKPEFDDQMLKGVVKNLLVAEPEKVTKVYETLASSSPETFGKDTYIPKLAPRLAEQYDKSDNGILVALITMNYLVLQAGDSIYIPADGIHAYLSGDIIECMARSNNVLNTGFCPRADRNNLDTFTETLTFSPHSADECILKPKPYKGSKKSTLYCPPLSEFDMLQVKLDSGDKEKLDKIDGPSIVLITKGSAKLKASDKSLDVTEGKVYFVAPNVELDFEGGMEGMLMHMAFVH